MSIDRDEGHEESEYHFSDEEVNYEVDAEAAKTTPAVDQSHKESVITRLASSKRMIISLVVFLVLVFVAYKMVGQTTSTPSTDITAVPTVAVQPKAMPVNQANRTQPPQVTAASTAPVASPVLAPVPSVPNVATNAINNTIPNQAAAPVPVAPQQPSMPAATVNAPAQVVEQPAIQQPAIQQLPVTLPLSNPPVVAALPAVIPVQSAAPVYNPINQPAVTPSVLTSMGAYIDARSAALNANSQKAIEQLQGQYTQQFNNFTTQNKALQDQVQTLSSRMAVMESQLTQLVQVLTRHGSNGAQGSSMSNSGAPPQIASSPEVKIAYNVQAIIPGRAWLKSENGETLTVAEGDTIKGVGRVTKIDPYDGVVEINTGNKAVSLSYGNGG